MQAPEHVPGPCASAAPAPRRRAGRTGLALGLAALAGLAVLYGLSADRRPPQAVTAEAMGIREGNAPGIAPAPVAAVETPPAGTLADAAPSVPATETPFAQSDPVQAAALDAVVAGSTRDAAVTPQVAQTIVPETPPELPPEIRPGVLAEAPQASPQRVPLPVPRPPEFRAGAAPGPVRRAARLPRRARTAAVAPAPAEDDRNVFEKFFGIERPAAPALAYAALEPGRPVEAAPRRALSPSPLTPVPAPSAGAGVAVYDISARTVTLPNGETLEAHSGLGGYMDDPRYVDQKMRGATPPGTYDLTEREDLFHGVRAIRLTPVGGAGAVYNRVGLLAHTYMLGPQGASNGCVAFRDYNRFLQAYLGGQIQRLVVVPGGAKQDLLSIFASR